MDNWNYLYKIDKNFPDETVETNLLYTPYYANGILKISFDHTSYYQNDYLTNRGVIKKNYTPELVEFFFNRELYFLEKLKNKSYAPTILEINKSEQYILIEFPGETLNQIVYTNRSLDKELPNWKQQLSYIIKDLYNSGYYKTSLYPHCFFIQDGILKTFDFYGCAERSKPYVNLSDIEGMTGPGSVHRFERASEDGLLNIEIFYKEALSKFIEWPDNLLLQVYKEIYHD
tara:strand:+ start:2557 stop:3246 length:690 start_codon:yes stop_codon:yes gene_type:complete